MEAYPDGPSSHSTTAPLSVFTLEQHSPVHTESTSFDPVPASPRSPEPDLIPQNSSLSPAVQALMSEVDAVLLRLATDVQLDEAPPANLKPDIVIVNHLSRDATVVDITCTYEGECDSFK